MKINYKNASVYLPIAFAIVLIIGIFVGKNINSGLTLDQALMPSNTNNPYNKLADIINYIEKDYVDPIDREKLTSKAVMSIIEELDPHTSYISQEEFNAVNDPLLGSFDGIGVQFNVIEDTIAIVQVIPGGPSEKSGIIAGDRITMVNDSLIAGVGITNNGAIRLLKGHRGTNVKVSVFRRGFPELINFDIIRNIIPTYSLDVAYMINDSVGYMKLNTFSATTYAEFSEAGKKLKQQGVKNIILDLRGNTGGYVRPAVQIADDFLADGKLIVYTKGNNRPKSSVYSKSNGLFETVNVIVLIDEASASASEILAGAIQDNDRGTIIGRRSFGKGLVQEQLNFPDGSGLRMTIARYYTPTGRSIQRAYGDGFDEYYNEFYHRYTNGELLSADSIKFADSLMYKTPGGKIVYGGGGIMPDLFVPIEMSNPIFYNVVINRGLAYQFAFNYTDTHREKLSKYKKPIDFIDSFEFTDEMYDEFVAFAISNGADNNEAEINKSAIKLKSLIKAYIGRNILDNDAFYPIFNKNDVVVIKAQNYLTSKK
ncbi:MAG: S41 family peptidase [Bacteroidetes bacterium]|nr:S41 family peptidase [Bacteroidota bacterium]